MLALIAASLFLSLTSPVFAGVDQLFEKSSSEKTWGEQLSTASGYDGFSKSYALVIGISDYTGGFNDLPTANDAARMASFLFEEAGFDHVHLLTEEKVTKDRVAELMSEIFPDLLDDNDRFLFYWSGHGDTRSVAVGEGKAGYLPLHDTKPGRWSRMIAMKDIRDWNIFLKARQTLSLMDSCFSGLAGFVPQSSTPQDWRIEQLAQPGHHVMSAGTENEKTIAADRWGGSLFTTAVLDGLRGAADAASGFSKDGIVSLTELKAYVQERVLFERQTIGWDSQITPQVRDLRLNAGEFFFLSGGGGGQRDKQDDEFFDDVVITSPPDEKSGEQSLAQAPVVREEPEPSPSPIEPVIGIPSYEPLSIFHDCDDCPEMVVIPKGSFFMGSRSSEPDSHDNERPRHKVNLKSFALGKHEVTFAEWDACVSAGGCDHQPDDAGWGRGDRPVINVSWEDAQQFVSWLQQLTGQTYRLPSESEWEYAARALPSSVKPNAPAYAFGNVITEDQANFKSGAGTKNVGSYIPNAWGLYDMHGNVDEWIEDRWHRSYDGAPSDGRAWVEGNETDRVIRGGAFIDFPSYLRSAYRSHFNFLDRRDSLGFRVLRKITP